MLERAELERIYALLKKHKENDFQEFFDLGYQQEASYGCCGQCTIYPFVKLLGIDADLFQYASCFCAGFGQVGTYPCGAFSAGALLLSYFFGRDITKLTGDIQESKNIFRNACRMMRNYEESFVGRYGGACCKDVQTCLFGRTFSFLKPEDAQIFEEMGGHKDKCTNVVGNAARTLAGMICDELALMLA